MNTHLKHLVQQNRTFTPEKKKVGHVELKDSADSVHRRRKAIKHYWTLFGLAKHCTTGSRQ